VIGIKMNHFKPRLVCATVVALSLTLACAPYSAADTQLEELAKRAGITVIADATSDQDVLDYTKARIPLAKMSPAAQQRANVILNNISQFRRMPSLQYEVDTNIYQYLVHHPDVSVSTWRAMGISTLKMWQTDKFEYEAAATDGSEGIADVLWRDGNQCLFIVEGQYSSPILPAAIQASALVWLQYRFVPGAKGKMFVNQQVETFVHFPSAAIDAIAKLANRVTSAILDRNVFEVSLYARMMSQAVEKDPDWIAQLAQQLDGVSPQRCKEFLLVAQGLQGSGRSMQPSTGSVSDRSNAGFAASGQLNSFNASFYSANVQSLWSAEDERPAGRSNAMMSRTPEGIENKAEDAANAKQPRREKVAEYLFYGANPVLSAAQESAESFPLPPSMHGPIRPTVEGLMSSPAPGAFLSHAGNSHLHSKASSGPFVEPQSTLLPTVELPFIAVGRHGNDKDDSSLLRTPMKTISSAKVVAANISKDVVEEPAELPPAD